MTAREIFSECKKMLELSGVPEGEAKAKVIVSHALDIEYPQVYTDTDVTDDKHREIQAMLGRCIAGEPVEYVTGKAYFRYLKLEVNPCVLIPRKETELVAEKAIELIKKNGYKNALDMCTGSGCIAVSLATETDAAVTASDISVCALEVAKRNAAGNGVFERICFLRSDMFGDIGGAYDIIVCNPPYVSESEYAALERSVKDYEPEQALKAGDGFEFFRTIARDAPARMNSGASLVLETGATQSSGVIRLLEKRGFAGAQFFKDYAGRERIVYARWE